MKQEYKDLRKQSIRETRKKRKNQNCKVYELKFDRSHLSNEKKEYLKRLFLEAKWLYNYILSQEDIFSFDTKNKIVEILNKNRKKETRELNVISSQMKQGIFGRICSSIKSLSRLKKNGKKIGKLKFKSRINSIPLSQFDHTYKVSSNKKYIRLQGFNKDLKIEGFSQIPKEVEFANAVLVRKQNDYYLMIACFLPKIEKEYRERAVGIDFGIKDNLVLSNGEKFKIDIPESDRTKNLQRELSKKKKGSKNRYKTRNKLEKSYYKTFCQKKDKRNKIVSYIINTFDIVCIQDENIKEWRQNWFGRQVQYSAMGGIISDLKRKSHTSIVVDKWFPSTKLCPSCGILNNIGLDKRIYKCECGYQEDRDIHSARNILTKGLKIPMECRNIKPVEKRTTADSVSSFQRNRKPVDLIIGSSQVAHRPVTHIEEA